MSFMLACLKTEPRGETLLNSYFLVPHQLPQLLHSLDFRRRQVHDHFQVWILAHLKCCIFQHEMSNVRVNDLFASALPSFNIVTRPPYSKLPAASFQLFNENREPRIPWRTTTTCAKLGQYPLCNSFPVHNTPPKL